MIFFLQSIHDDGNEDRLFAFRCGQASKNSSKSCSWTSYVNDFDKYFAYAVRMNPLDFYTEC